MSTPIIMVRQWNKNYPADNSGFGMFSQDTINLVKDAVGSRDVTKLGNLAVVWYSTVGSFQDFLPDKPWEGEYSKGISLFEGAYSTITGRSASAYSWPWKEKVGLPGREIPGSMPQPNTFRDAFETVRAVWASLPPVAKVGVFAGAALLVLSILSGEQKYERE